MGKGLAKGSITHASGSESSTAGSVLVLFRLPLSELVSLPGPLPGGVLRRALPPPCGATSSRWTPLNNSEVDNPLLRRRFEAMDFGNSFPRPLDWTSIVECEG